MIKRLAIFTLIISLALCIVGCEKNSINNKESIKSIQNKYLDTDLKTNVHILSNLNERTLEYDLSYEYNKDSDSKIEIISPKEIAGIKAIVNQDTYTLNYEGTSLETAMPDRKGLTPVDVIPNLIADIQKSYPTQVWSENGKMIARFEQTTDDGLIAKEIYFDECTSALSEAEIFFEDQRILGCTFTKFEFAN